jgi:hypothetical protein
MDTSLHKSDFVNVNDIKIPVLWFAAISTPIRPAYFTDEQRKPPMISITINGCHTSKARSNNLHRMFHKQK